MTKYKTERAMKFISRERINSIVSEQLATTGWFKVNQEQNNQFADCTHDHHFIHVDPDKAKDTPFGSTIAHGFLSLSMLSHFAESFGVVIEGIHTAINYGFGKIRFISPVHVDKPIRCHAKVADIVEKNPGQFMIAYEVEVEVEVGIEGGTKPALKTEWITMQMVK
jgi:acyl dehydratase